MRKNQTGRFQCPVSSFSIRVLEHRRHANLFGQHTESIWRKLVLDHCHLVNKSFSAVHLLVQIVYHLANFVGGFCFHPRGESNLSTIELEKSWCSSPTNLSNCPTGKAQQAAKRVDSSKVDSLKGESPKFDLFWFSSSTVSQESSSESFQIRWVSRIY